MIILLISLALFSLPYGLSVAFRATIFNNLFDLIQVGYTTEGDRSRSTSYSSDIGRIISCPVLRVNADHPDRVAHACRLAMDYRARYGRDIIVDYICYRRWGHNELDEPGFTQPVMYKAIRNRPSIPDAYAER